MRWLGCGLDVEGTEKEGIRMSSRFCPEQLGGGGAFWCVREGCETLSLGRCLDRKCVLAHVKFEMLSGHPEFRGSCQCRDLEVTDLKVIRVEM